MIKNDLNDNALFSCIIELDRFPIKKNNKSIFRTKSGRPFIATNSKAQNLIAQLEAKLLMEKLRHKDFKTIDCDVNVQMLFCFPKKVFFNSKGKRSKKIADIANLYQAIEDTMQKIQIIENDSLICSHNFSDRLPILGENHILKLVITKKEVNFA